MFDNLYVEDLSMIIEKAEKEEKEKRLGFNVNELKSKIKENTISGKDIKSKLTRLIAHSPESLASDVPTIMDVITAVIIVGIPTMITPLLTIPTLIVTKVVRDCADAKIIGKYISEYNLQIQRVEKKIEKEEDAEKKKFYQRLKTELESSRATLMSKKDELRDLDPEGNSKTAEEIKEMTDALDLLEEEYYRLSINERAELYDEELLNEGIVDKTKMAAKNVKKTVNDKQEAMDKWFDDTLKDIRNKTRNRTREEVVEDSFPKLSKMIKRAIVLGTTAAINPVIAAISAMTMFVISKKATEREKKRLLSELSKELEIVEAKIQDADSSGDRKQKYELIRLRQKIQTNIDKIKGYII